MTYRTDESLARSVRADHGSIAAGRDAHVHQHAPWPYRPCPVCQTRMVALDARACRACRHAARDLRRRRIGGSALAGFALCLAIGVELVETVGLHDHRWSLGALAALGIFCLGAWAWVKSDVPRCLRSIGRVLMHPRRLTRWLRRVSMRFRPAMAAPTRRAPGSDEETCMEPNAEAARAEKVYAEISKLMAETVRINTSARWYSRLAMAGLIAFAVAIVRFLL